MVLLAGSTVRAVAFTVAVLPGSLAAITAGFWVIRAMVRAPAIRVVTFIMLRIKKDRIWVKINNCLEKGYKRRIPLY
jgi:hypothetical protein